jgi:hypothetical protein
MMDRIAMFRARFLLTLIIVLTTGYSVYRILHMTRYNRTALLFVGLPAIAALIVTFLPPGRSLTGAVARVITIALLLMGILSVEGLVCIIFAAPLFYAVGFVVVWLIESVRKRQRPDKGASIAALIPIFLLSLEGIHPATTVPRTHEVSVREIVHASAEQVGTALAQAPVFDKLLPRFLRLGFPRPVSAEGSGLTPGDRRVVEFSAASALSRVEFVVSDSAPGVVRFRAVSDGTVIGRWLTWKEAVVRWEPAGENRTAVTWTLRFRRDLDPAWYFSPLERYGARQAAVYLIRTLATP